MKESIKNATNQKPRNYPTRSRRELLLVGTQQGNPKESIKRKIKSVHSGFQDLETKYKVT